MAFPVGVNGRGGAEPSTLTSRRILSSAAAEVWSINKAARIGSEIPDSRPPEISRERRRSWEAKLSASAGRLSFSRDTTVCMRLGAQRVGHEPGGMQMSGQARQLRLIEDPGHGAVLRP